MCEVTVGKLIKHNGDGYGFKLTFSDEHTAVKMKQIIGSMLFKCFNGEVVVDQGGRYDKE